jgi:glycerate kinase
MKVICAPDKFKESLTAPQAAQAIARGVRRVFPDARIDLCPIADGGEGTVDALLAATDGQARVSTVQGPRGQSVDARWGLLGRARENEPLTAVLEMAAASGLALLSQENRNPLLTSTYGTGQLIASALEAGARKIILGIGGSATNDGGCGALQALGARFYDHHRQLITTPITGQMLAGLSRIDLSQLHAALKHTRIVVACDVTNPLTGPQGAAVIYSPQKGATPQMVTQLDQGLRHLASLWRSQLGCDVETTPGSGAAGGLGGGLMAMLGATLQGGIAMVLEGVDFASRAAHADVCFTGEGRLDGQSLSGKACLGVAQAARDAGTKKVIALVGSAAQDADLTLQAGLDAYHVIGQGLSKEESMKRAAELLESAVVKVMQTWKAGA